MKKSERWYRACLENFETARDQGNIPLARVILCDMSDGGYVGRARLLARTLTVKVPEHDFVSLG